MRSKRKQDWSDVPSREMIQRAHTAALRLKRSLSGQEGGVGQFGSCKVWGNAGSYSSGPISGSPDMSNVRKNSNYRKWEVMPVNTLRKEAQDHFMQMDGVSLYKMDGNKLEDLATAHTQNMEILYIPMGLICFLGVLVCGIYLYLCYLQKDLSSRLGLLDCGGITMNTQPCWILPSNQVVAFALVLLLASSLCAIHFLL